MPKKQNKPVVPKFNPVQDDGISIDYVHLVGNERETFGHYSFSFFQDHQPTGTVPENRCSNQSVTINFGPDERMKKLERKSKKQIYNRQQKNMR
jgi:hypothetical protein